MWIDVETTGLDEHKDELLEIGILVTDQTLNQLGSRKSVIWHEALPAFDSSIAKMHIENGLFAACERAGTSHIRSRIDREFREWILQNKFYNLPLAGSNPSFDRRFCEVHLPRTAALFHHRHFETNNFRVMFPSIEKPQPDVKHRAMPDILCEIEYTKSFLHYAPPNLITSVVP